MNDKIRDLVEYREHLIASHQELRNSLDEEMNKLNFEIADAAGLKVGMVFNYRGVDYRISNITLWGSEYIFIGLYGNKKTKSGVWGKREHYITYKGVDIEAI